MNHWIYIYIFCLSIAGCTKKNIVQTNRSEVNGLYINYQDTEYEKVFVKCGTNDIWSLSRGDNVVQQKLQELYTSEETYLNTYGEMLVTLSGRFEKYDLELYPNSHLKGDFLVNEFVYQDNNPEKVSGCKLKGKAANKRPIK